jgi:hypothetical protein
MSYGTILQRRGSNRSWRTRRLASRERPEPLTARVDDADVIARDVRIVTDDRELLGASLCDQQSIERVGVMSR